MLELLAARLSLKFKEMEVEGIRKFFGVEKDYNEQEEKDILAQNEEAKETYDIQDWIY